MSEAVVVSFSIATYGFEQPDDQSWPTTTQAVNGAYQSFDLRYGGRLAPDLASQWPYLSPTMTLIVGPEAAATTTIKALVKCRLVVAISNADGFYTQATEVQTAKVCRLIMPVKEPMKFEDNLSTLPNFITLIGVRLPCSLVPI